MKKSLKSGSVRDINNYERRIEISTRRLSAWYVVRRCIVFCIAIIVAGSINFIVPRLAPGDPVRAILERMNARGVRIEAGEEFIQSYREMFGLDESVFIQYFKYLRSSFQLKFGYSISYFPAEVADLIWLSIPWTLGFLSVATLIAFAVGIFLGALLAYMQGTSKSNAFINMIILFFMMLGAIPYYLLGIVLLYVFSFTLGLFPTRGATSIGATAGFSLEAILDILHHSTLPALSIILVSIGYWALGMRGMMISTIGEDYLTLAEAKGLSKRRIFWHYAVRNAVLPQITVLIMSLGMIVSGAILVEVMFSYPGIGWLLFSAISNSDYPLIQGITFFLVLAIASATFVLDLVYPWLDPRITYTEK